MKFYTKPTYFCSWCLEQRNTLELEIPSITYFTTQFQKKTVLEALIS